MYIITASTEHGIMLNCPHCQHTVYCRRFAPIPVKGRSSVSPYFQAARSIQAHMDGHKQHQNTKRGTQSEDRVPL